MSGSGPKSLLEIMVERIESADAELIKADSEEVIRAQVEIMFRTCTSLHQTKDYLSVEQRTWVSQRLRRLIRAIQIVTFPAGVKSPYDLIANLVIDMQPATGRVL